jgi:hypothetical protein
VAQANVLQTSLSVALEEAFDQPAGAQAISIVIKLVRLNDCSLCDGPAQVERPSLCLGIK